jgi:hypothetical protein
VAQSLIATLQKSDTFRQMLHDLPDLCVSYKVAVACIISCSVCADYDKSSQAALAVLPLDAVDAALLHPVYQIFDERSVRHYDHRHTGVVHASWHAKQQALASTGRQHDDERRLSVDYCVQRLLLLCGSNPTSC